MRIREFERLASRRLTECGRESPRLTAQLLMAHVLGLERAHLIAHSECALTATQEAELSRLLDRRARGEPVAYILGEREFYGRSFKVSPAVLIPRPETEHLIEALLERTPSSPFRFADLGCGSGAIGISLALERKESSGILLDISPDALGLARENTARHDLGPRLDLILADFAHLPLPDHVLDAVVSNPPYIGERGLELVMDEVLEYEPRLALFAGEDGLDQIRALIPEAARVLKRDGVICIEHGWDQGSEVRILLSNFFTDVVTIRDLSGHERLSTARRT